MSNGAGDDADFTVLISCPDPTPPTLFAALRPSSLLEAPVLLVGKRVWAVGPTEEQGILVGGAALAGSWGERLPEGRSPPGWLAHCSGRWTQRLWGAGSRVSVLTAPRRGRGCVVGKAPHRSRPPKAASKDAVFGSQNRDTWLYCIILFNNYYFVYSLVIR